LLSQELFQRSGSLVTVMPPEQLEANVPSRNWSRLNMRLRGETIAFSSWICTPIYDLFYDRKSI
jgi:hypothetical protein